MSEPGLDVRACLESVRGGDEEAARALMNHLYPMVMKMIRSHLPRRTSEEDLAQTVFMKIFSKLDQYSGAVPLEHWASRVAINTCLNQIDKERVRPEVRMSDLSEAEEEVVQALATSEDELPMTQSIGSRELVERLLERLSPADRLVVTLLHLEGRSVEEVRAITGWGASLVKVRAFRARLKLKSHLGALMKEHTL